MEKYYFNPTPHGQKLTVKKPNEVQSITVTLIQGMSIGVSNSANYF